MKTQKPMDRVDLIIDGTGRDSNIRDLEVHAIKVSTSLF